MRLFIMEPEDMVMFSFQKTAHFLRTLDFLFFT